MASFPPFRAAPLALALFAVFHPSFAAETPSSGGSVDAKAGPALTLDEVVVTRKRPNDTEERRNSTAAKMVFGREELDRHGDSSLGDVLKRLPGVTLSGTPGRGGDIRMRGLGNGYTLILINGEPAPRGFSLDSLSPDLVERIEVMRAPVAENSARAIGGTINIVLREAFVKKDNEAKFTLGSEQGRLQPGFSAQKDDVLGALSYNLHANVSHRDLGSESRIQTTAVNTVTGVPTLSQLEQDSSRTTSDNIHISSRLNWKLNGGDSLSIQPFLMASRSNTLGQAHLDQSVGASPAPYANAAWRTDADNAQFRTMGNWKARFDGGGQLDWRFNLGLADSNNTTSRIENNAAGAVAHTAWNSAGISDTTLSTAAKYSRPLGQRNNFAGGLELEQGKRKETATTIQDGVLQLAQYGNSLQATTDRVAAFGQDEWHISPLWSAYGGLRWESIRTTSQWLDNTVQNNSSVLSPLFHSVWRFTEESKDQVRLGLTRSYKAPTLAQLVPRPTLASAYPANGANTATNADSSGNPALKPELAWGLDLAFEHYLTDGGLFSASVFQRNIDNLIRNVTTLQTVNWSPVQRFVSTPQNFGHATTRGIELEAKFRLSELIAGAPQLDLRANYSRYWSRVDSVAGPDNRLDQQPSATANLGLDYRLRSVPLTVGGNLNWTPSFIVQQTDTQAYSQSNKKVFEVYGLWQFNPNAKLRLSAANLLHADYDTANRATFATTDQLAQTDTKTYVSFAARLELKF